MNRHEDTIDWSPALTCALGNEPKKKKASLSIHKTLARRVNDVRVLCAGMLHPAKLMQLVRYFCWQIW